MNIEVNFDNLTKDEQEYLNTFVKDATSCLASSNMHKDNSVNAEATVFVVTADGWNGGYGCEIYLLGVFTNREDADRCATQFAPETSITEVEINKAYPLKPDEDGDNKNELYLGGYLE
jgi:hypothetical protein